MPDLRRAAAARRSAPLRLDRIEARHVRLPLRHPFETSFGRTTDKEFLLVSVTAGGVTGHGGTKDLARVDQRGIERAARDQQLSGHGTARIQQKNQELLLLQVAQARAAQREDIARLADLGPGARSFAGQPTAQFHSRGHPGGHGRTHPRDLQGSSVQQAREPPE